MPFNVLFKGENADQELFLKPREELPGIFNWAVQEALNWKIVGLAPPSAVMTATDAYHKDSDELDGFLSDRCVVADGVKVEPGHLFAEYQHWAQEQGILERHRLGSRSFGTRIRGRFGNAVASDGKRHGDWIESHTVTQMTQRGVFFTNYFQFTLYKGGL